MVPEGVLLKSHFFFFLYYKVSLLNLVCFCTFSHETLESLKIYNDFAFCPAVEAQELHSEISRTVSNVQQVIVNCTGASVAVGPSDLKDAWYNFSVIKQRLYCSLWGDKQLAVKALSAWKFITVAAHCLN